MLHPILTSAACPLGEDIKERRMLRAIDWFSGEALQFEELDDDTEEGNLENDDDEEDNKEKSH